MNWEVEYTDTFEEWWDNLTKAEQTSVAATVELLEKRGPQLPFPHSSGINGPNTATCANYAPSTKAAPTAHSTPSTHAEPLYCS